MEMFNIRYRSKDHLNQFIKKNKLQGKELLVLVFTNVEPVDTIVEVNTHIMKMLPESTLTGCSAAGTIEGVKVHEEGIHITFCCFQYPVEISGSAYKIQDKNEEEVGSSMAKDILRDHSQLLLLFAEGLHTNPSRLLQGVSKESDQVPVAGGMAGDNLRLEKTLVFLNHQVLENSVVGVSLNSHHLMVSAAHRLNWKRIGKEMKVTKSMGNQVYEIDHRPVTEIYHQYLGINKADALPHSIGADFPLMVHRKGMDLARCVVGIHQDGSMLYAGDLLENEVVQFGYGNPSMMLENMEEDFPPMKSVAAEAALIFSCAARKALLGEHVLREIKPLSRVMKTAGLFTYGEFYRKEHTNHVLNATMTMVFLSEDSHRKPEVEWDEYTLCRRNTADRQLSSIKALTHLVDQVTSELEEANQKLTLRNEQLFRVSQLDGLTGLYNHKAFYDLLKREIELARDHEKTMALAMIDLDYFKEVNDECGHTIGDKLLQLIGQTLKDCCRQEDVVCRYGGDEFAIIFPNTKREQAYRIIQRIQEEIKKLTPAACNKPISMSAGIVAGKNLNFETLVEWADELLYKAKKSGRNKVKI